MDPMNRYVISVAVAAAAGLVTVAAAVPAVAATSRPSVQSLSGHSGVYWGAGRITIHGQNFVGVRQVNFGSSPGQGVQVLSATTLTVGVPWHDYGTVNVQVITGAGASPTSAADRFTFIPPTMDTPIQGGLTGHQEQAISATVRAHHVTPPSAGRAGAWTAAMGATAANRARSWLGLPYSWAGGNGSGPTTGVCAHNGGDLDCQIDGFDCSGLALYAWSPYKAMDHFAASQYVQAGAFHPTTGELMPGDLVFFAAYPGGEIDHVVIYVGNGQVVEAPESGEQVRVSQLADLLSWSVYAGATRPTSTGRQGPTPTITSIAPELSTKGGQVTVAGANLDSTTSVTIAGTRIYSFAQRTSSRLVFTVPPHAAGAVNLEVDNSWGSATGVLSYVGPPTVAITSPNHGLTIGGTSVTLSGQYLSAVTRVALGSAALPFSHSGPNRLIVQMPTHLTGGVSLVVTSPYGTSSSPTYTYSVPTPRSRPGLAMVARVHRPI
jgi:cell wall-associated NlpC family hydrolase